MSDNARSNEFDDFYILDGGEEVVDSSSIDEKRIRVKSGKLVLDGDIRSRSSVITVRGNGHLVLRGVYLVRGILL